MEERQVQSIINELFPLNRSVTGKGLRDSLAVINRYTPIQVLEYPSGETCFDWQIPLEWTVSQAYIENEEGERVLDFSENNLHLLAYSTGYDGWVSREILLDHLYSLPEQPHAIPYITSVYKKRWGFCIEEHRKKGLTDPRYYVKIDADLAPGSLSIGEGLLAGKSSQEIILFTYTGHPSMGNDQLSGMVSLMLVYDWLLQQKDLNFTYRILFCPETIGTAAYLSRNLKQLQKNFLAGYTVVFCGDPSPLRYKSSLLETTLGDRAATNILRYDTEGGQVIPYSPFGADERHFNAPGIDLPFGSFMRAGPNGYAEYHTSLDNLEFIHPERLMETADTVIKTIKNLETNISVQTKHFGFEPKLDKLGLYPDLGKKFDHKDHAMKMLAIWRLSGRHNDLIDIADRIKMPAYTLVNAMHTAKHINLIK